MIYAISDLHLGIAVDKPMEIFGHEWAGHTEKIKHNWENTVTDDDTVLIPGDISWGTQQEVIPDLKFINELPGRKIIFPGNHDAYWWKSLGKIKSLFPTITFIKHGWVEVEGHAICGSRGWDCPDDTPMSPHDEKIYKRELLRVEAALKVATNAGHKNPILVLHFPATNRKLERSGFIELIEQYCVKTVVYGHLHKIDDVCLRGKYKGVFYQRVSANLINFTPTPVMTAKISNSMMHKLVGHWISSLLKRYVRPVLPTIRHTPDA